jgi:prefoldin beta subunit
MASETDQKINQLQMLEQNTQQYQMQKQQFQAQLLEIDSALQELKTTKQSYKIIGNIMVASDKDSLEKELATKKEMLEIRIRTLEKQEQKLKDKAKEIQKEVLSSMKNDN